MSQISAALYLQRAIKSGSSRRRRRRRSRWSRSLKLQRERHAFSKKTAIRQWARPYRLPKLYGILFMGTFAYWTVHTKDRANERKTKKEYIYEIENWKLWNSVSGLIFFPTLWRKKWLQSRRTRAYSLEKLPFSVPLLLCSSLSKRVKFLKCVASKEEALGLRTLFFLVD